MRKFQQNNSNGIIATDKFQRDNSKGKAPMGEFPWEKIENPKGRILKGRSGTIPKTKLQWDNFTGRSEGKVLKE